MDMAKELSMVENNKMEVFLSCRKQIDRNGIKRMEEESMSVDLLKHNQVAYKKIINRKGHKKICGALTEKEK